MTTVPGSVVPPTQGVRRSSRPGRGSNGRDTQLDRLGDVLAAPARQAQKRFAPTDGLVLPNNALAPAPKRRRRNNKVLLNVRSFSTVLMDPKATLPPPPPATPPPRQEPLPNIDPRLGFFTPHPPSTPSPIPPQLNTLTQPLSSHTTRRSPPQPFITPPSIHLPPSYPPPPNMDPTPGLDDSGSEVDDGDGVQNPESDIDERSDDEDDRAAHKLLRAAPIVTQDFADPLTVLPYNHRGFAELNNDNSVLQAHYARNRTPKAPNPSHIHRTPAANPLPPPVPKADNTPRTYNSYPDQWHEVISNAKRTFRAYVAGQDGFPDAIQGVEEARECLEDALAVHLEEGWTVEPNHQINRDMIMLVYAESWLFRSQLKADIRTQVRNLKSLFPDQFKGTAHELQSRISNTVKMWASDGSYLHDTVPSSDDQIHFAHPIIASTAKSFYFDKWHGISTHDRDTFKGSVPKPLIALIGTVYRNALDEWSNGHPSTVKLERKEYKPVYDEILRMMVVVENDQIDGPRLHERLTAWAGFGTSMNAETGAASRIPTTISLKLSSSR